MLSLRRGGKQGAIASRSVKTSSGESRNMRLKYSGWCTVSSIVSRKTRCRLTRRYSFASSDVEPDIEHESKVPERRKRQQLTAVHGRLLSVSRFKSVPHCKQARLAPSSTYCCPHSLSPQLLFVNHNFIFIGLPILFRFR